MHVIAAKAVAFKEALDPSFTTYQDRVVRNANAMSNRLMDRGFCVLTGGSDNHISLVDLRSKQWTGRDAERILDSVGVTTNKNSVPFDTESPFVTSGLRLGTPAATTRGFNEAEFEQTVDIIDMMINHPDDATVHDKARQQVRDLCEQDPIYP